MHRRRPRDSRNDGAQPAKPMKPRVSLADRLWKMFVWGAMAFFLFNVLLLIATVAVNSVATRWFGTLLPRDSRCTGTRRHGATSSLRACCG
jgi:putative spermidine/putrescine transport system permease protein